MCVPMAERLERSRAWTLWRPLAPSWSNVHCPACVPASARCFNPRAHFPSTTAKSVSLKLMWCDMSR